MQVKIDDLSQPAVLALLRSHLASMYELTPPESVHALGIDALRQPDVTVWTAWEHDDLMGCGALKTLDARHGEVKSMRTVQRFLRRGVAATLLQTIIDEASHRGLTRLSLETGAGSAFDPAVRLYERFGFQSCAPFADYKDDPLSRFLTLTVTPVA
jgi:putative acetyltransferase